MPPFSVTALAEFPSAVSLAPFAPLKAKTPPVTRMFPVKLFGLTVEVLLRSSVPPPVIVQFCVPVIWPLSVRLGTKIDWVPPFVATLKVVSA